METNAADELLKVIQDETGLRAELNTPVDDLGLDSLEFVDLMMVISAKIKPVPEAIWAKFDTVADIAEALL